MKTKFLYFNNTYVYTNEELRKNVQECIEKGENKDLLIRSLSDLYRNGHLRDFCQQEEYENGIEKKNYKISFDDNIIGDIRVANHVASRLIGDDSYAPFAKDFHKHFDFSSVTIFRSDEPEILSNKLKQTKDGDTIFLLNGFRNHIHLQYTADIQIKYALDNKESLNEQIPIFINGKKTDITIDLSKAREKQEIKIPILEALLDPTNDIEVWFGPEGSYGRIILKAPQINVPIQFNNEIVNYPMMRIFNGTTYFYVGVWPFEYNNTNEWKKKIKTDSVLYEEYYAKRKIDFYLLPNTGEYHLYAHRSEFLDRFIILDNSLEAHGWSLFLPSKDEWSYAARIERGEDLTDVIVEQKKEGESYGLCSKQLMSRFRPNAYGVYAMMGNIYEATLEDMSVSYMGGNLRDHSDVASYFSSSDRVPFYGIRFVLHNVKNTKDIPDEPENPFGRDEDPFEEDYLRRMRMDY